MATVFHPVRLQWAPVGYATWLCFLHYFFYFAVIGRERLVTLFARYSAFDTWPMTSSTECRWHVAASFCYGVTATDRTVPRRVTWHSVTSPPSPPNTTNTTVTHKRAVAHAWCFVIGNSRISLNFLRSPICHRTDLSPASYIPLHLIQSLSCRVWGSHSGTYVAIFRVIAPCSQYVNRRFGGISPPFSGSNISRARSQPAAGC
jgi:hypothetical protein